jgi:hypothetical protein
MVAGSVALIFMATSDHTELYGDIVVPERVYSAGQPLPMEFVPPEELEDIHGLMWDVNYKNDGIEDNIIDNLLEGEDILLEYTQEEINELFEKDVKDLSRVAIYHPPSSGTLTIELAGFYRQTNPQFIAEIEVVIHDE